MPVLAPGASGIGHRASQMHTVCGARWHTALLLPHGPRFMSPDRRLERAQWCALRAARIEGQAHAVRRSAPHAAGDAASSYESPLAKGARDAAAGAGVASGVVGRRWCSVGAPRLARGSTVGSRCVESDDHSRDPILLRSRAVHRLSSPRPTYWVSRLCPRRRVGAACRERERCVVFRRSGRAPPSHGPARSTPRDGD